MDDNVTPTAAAPAPNSSGADAAPRRLFRNYLIDAGLQLRMATYLTAVAVAISGALGWMLWSAYRETSRVVALADPQSTDALAATLAAVDKRRMLWLIAGLIVVVGWLLLFAVVVTHRIAGPAHFLTRICRQVAEGNLSRPRALRRGDLLVELADEVGVMVDMLRQREERERSLLAAAVEKLRRAGPSSGEFGQALETLDKLAQEKGRRLTS
jgi:methyl-accepting chemotaxis protein